MNHGVTPQQEDWMEKRFESFVHTINTLMQENTKKTVEAVEAQIKVTVNGKIDKIAKHLEEQDADMVAHKAEQAQSMKLVFEAIDSLKTDTDPLVKVKNGAIGSMKVLLYLATAVTVLGGAYLVLINIF